LIALLERLKPITVDGVVTNFQLAVNRAIRESVDTTDSHPDVSPDTSPDVSTDTAVPKTGSP
jgi:hypothetical protein